MTDRYADLRKATQIRNIFCSPEAIFGYRAAANPDTIRALLADYDRMRDALNGAVAVAREAHAHWDADRDAKVGKLLLALSGYALGYDPRTDAVQTALAQEQGGSYERPR